MDVGVRSRSLNIKPTDVSIMVYASARERVEHTNAMLNVPEFYRKSSKQYSEKT